MENIFITFASIGAGLAFGIAATGIPSILIYQKLMAKRSMAHQRNIMQHPHAQQHQPMM